MKTFYACCGALITVSGLVYGTIAWDRTQRMEVERQVGLTLQEYRKELQVKSLLERLIQAEGQVELWEAYARAHPHDAKAVEALAYWQEQVKKLREKLR